MAFFAERASLTAEQITSLTHGGPEDACWDDRDQLLIAAADQLHDRADIDDDLWRELGTYLTNAQLLDLTMLSGWYHAISFSANAARVAREDGAPSFADVARAPS